jgi:hypothetical protein
MITPGFGASLFPFVVGAPGAARGVTDVQNALLSWITMGVGDVLTPNRTFELMRQVEGKPTTTSRVVRASDGKTLTVTTTGKNSQGQTVNDVIVYNKQ